VLARTPLITRERGSGTRLNAEQIMADAGHPPVPPLVELPTTAAIRTAVHVGAGVAILSILAVRDDIAAGRLVRVRVRGLRFVRELRAVYARVDELAPELRTLLAVATRGA
jgi:DNA-binding transcriptional LysR family regulator